MSRIPLAHLFVFFLSCFLLFFFLGLPFFTILAPRVLFRRVSRSYACRVLSFFLSFFFSFLFNHDRAPTSDTDVARARALESPARPLLALARDPRSRAIRTRHDDATGPNGSLPTSARVSALRDAFLTVSHDGGHFRAAISLVTHVKDDKPRRRFYDVAVSVVICGKNVHPL